MVIILAAMAVGCSDDAATVDASPGDAVISDAVLADVLRDDASLEGCNLWLQAGCSPTKRCTFVWTNFSPLEGAKRCVPDGSVPIGVPCMVDGSLNYDNCQMGALCWDPTQATPVCTEICGTNPQDTCATGTCTTIAGLFRNDEGVCSQ